MLSWTPAKKTTATAATTRPVTSVTPRPTLRRDMLRPPSGNYTPVKLAHLLALSKQNHCCGHDTSVQSNPGNQLRFSRQTDNCTDTPEKTSHHCQNPQHLPIGQQHETRSFHPSTMLIIFLTTTSYQREIPDTDMSR